MKAIVPSSRGTVERISVDQLASIPEEAIWLASRKSARTRQAYRIDVTHFLPPSISEHSTSCAAWITESSWRGAAYAP